MRRAQLAARMLTAAGLAAVAPALFAAATEPPKVDPAAMKALSEMGGYLRGLQAFEVSAATTDEDVLDDGQKVQYDGEVELLVEMPNRLRAKTVDQRRERIFFYDGATFTLYGKRVNFFASVAAPPTIRELAARLESEHGLSLPLADLFRWGAPGYEPTEITAAIDAGPGAIRGAGCHHWIFRQAGLDWQLWIQSGKHPLPRKLVITTTSDPARPQYTAVYTWNLAPAYAATDFTFVPPTGAGRVRLAPGE